MAYRDPDVGVFRELLKKRAEARGQLSLAEQREVFDRDHGKIAPAAGCAIEAVDLAGVPAEKMTPTGAPAGKALIYFHGGGHYIGSLTSHRHFVSRLAVAAGVTTFNVGYRLAPEHPYPAGLEDAVKVYRRILDLGFAAHDIVVGGESAGGNLSAALLLKLRDLGVPQPAGVYLLSPWLDMTASGQSYEKVAGRDPMITRDGITQIVKLYLGGKPDDAYTSPIRADLAGLPPMLIQVGSEEVLLSDSLTFAHNAALAGIDVKLHVAPEMPHAWPLFHFVIRAGLVAIDEAGQWMQQRLALERLRAAA
jgi:epsilon-lactone hydrolase